MKRRKGEEGNEEDGVENVNYDYAVKKPSIDISLQITAK